MVNCWNIFNKKEFYNLRNNILFYNKNYSNGIDIIKSNFDEFIEISKNCDTIILGEIFSSDISKIPPNIKNIFFENNMFDIFNKEIQFPYGIKKIRFGDNFNYPLDNLPSSLEELEFSQDSQFNQLIDNLPCMIKKITFGKYFNAPLNNLPPNLEYLSIQSDIFSFKLNNIPTGLKYLYFSSNSSYSYDKIIEGFPEGILEIGYPFEYNYEIDNLPKSIKIVRVSNEYKYLDKLKLLYPDIKIFVY